MRLIIGITLAVVMSYYFQYGDKDPFAGKSDTERLELWGSDKLGEIIDAKFDKEWEIKQMRDMGR